jgi:hypothetical protein
MGCFSGPKVVNDGLVFYMDSNNTRRSWRGKPTVNLIGSNFFNGNGNFTINQNINHFMPDGSVGVARLLNAQFVSDANRTVSIGSYSLQAGQTYTLSFYAMNIDCSGFSGNLYSPTLLRSIGSIVYPALSLDTWTRVSTTFTVPNEGPNPVVLSPQAFRDGGNGRFKLCWLQLEEGSFATPYIDGTRANTQALVDLSGINTLTATNLTYNSDGSFAFNGTNSTITLPNISPYDFSSEQTIEIWLKPTENDAARRNPYNQAYGGYGTWTHEPSGEFNYYYGDAGINNTPYVGHTSGFTVVQNEVACICSTRDTTKSRWYKNGVYSNEYAHPYGTLTATTADISIGSGYAGFYQGDIYSVKIYNRALTENQVRENFNSIRGKYGI